MTRINPLISIFALIGLFWLTYTLFNKLVYLPIINHKNVKIKEKEAINKKLKKLEFDNIQFKNDILRLDLELKDLKKVSKK